MIEGGIFFFGGHAPYGHRKSNTYILFFVFFFGRGGRFSLSYVPDFTHLKVLATRMTTFIKTKYKKSDDQTIIDKYRVAANIILYQN